MPIYIEKELSDKVIMLSVTYETNRPSGGGVSSVVASYAKYFDNLHHITTWKPGNKLIKVITAFTALLKFIWKMTFDHKIKIVHIHSAAWASFERKSIFIKLGHFFGKKVILHMHAADFIPYLEQSNHKEKILKTLKIPDKMIVLSTSWKDYFQSIGVKVDKLEILNNIVSEPEYMNINEDKGLLKLLFLGELSHRKGIFDLLKAVKDNKNDYEGRVKIKLGGNGNEEKINEIIKNDHLENIVCLEGWVSGAKKIECLNWADIYILPSYNEGLPIGILESMSYSHPIISTSVGGISEVLFNNINGKLIEPGKPKKINESIVYYLNHPEAIEKHGKESYRIVQEFFPKQVLNHLKQIYKELL